jgi:ribose transport system permease protein
MAPGNESGYKSVWRALTRVQNQVPLLQLLATVGVFLVGWATLPGLASPLSIRLILTLASIAGLASLGQTLLILMGGFDLSVAGFIVAGALFVTQVRDRLGISFGSALLIALALAAAFGALAGFICHRFRIQPLIVTLATGTIALGLVQTQTPGGLTFGAAAPNWLVSLCSPNSKTFGIGVPPLVAIWVAVGVAMAVMLHRTVAGRKLIATGANRRAAEYALIKTRRVWVVVFAISAVASTLVGLLVAGFGGAITTSSGDPYLFQSCIAVFVGGTTFGGPGDYTRTIVGALFVTVVGIVLVGHGASAADQEIIYGAAILVAASIYNRGRRLRDRI